MTETETHPLESLSSTLKAAQAERDRRKKALEQAAGLRKSFRHFVAACWDTVEPAKPLIPTWSIDAIADHLQAVADRKIQNLLMNVPPGTCKSLLTSVMFPAWMWTRDPGWRSMFASYEATLSTRDSVRCRDLLKSIWYQESFEPSWKFATDQDEKTYYYNTDKGFRVSTSVGGKGTGLRAHFLGIDDPINVNDQDSDAKLEACVNWYDRTWYNRLVDMKTGARVVIMQRVGDRDLSGHLLRRGGFEHLMIPMEYDPARSRVTCIGWKDPRTRKDELMSPDVFPQVVVDDTRKTLGPGSYCTPGYTPILMSDWTERRIEDIRVGDEVVGYQCGSLEKKTFLVRSRVVRVSKSDQMVFRVRMASGREVHCTTDHKWFTRMRAPGKPEYMPAKIGTRLTNVYTPPSHPTQEQQRSYDWLGGIIDGEGSCATRGVVSISQAAINSEVQAAITSCLNYLEIDFGFWSGPRKNGKVNPRWSQRGMWQLNGGRSTKIKLLAHCRMAKKQRFTESLWASGGSISEKINGKSSKYYKQNHKVVSIEPIGMMAVYGLTTTTGNYVAWGFASQNSGQYQQSPAPDGGGILKSHKWNYWRPASMDLPPVRVKMPDGTIQERYAIARPDDFDLELQSWDFAFKDLKSSDYVAGMAIGVHGADRFVLKLAHGKMDLPASIAAVRIMTADVPKAHLKLVEDKANGPAVIQSLRHEIPGIVEVNPEGQKVSRAASATPELESGNWYLPHPMIAPWVGDPSNPTSSGFLAESVLFPFGANDDMVDCWSQAAVRIRKEQIGGVFGVSESAIRVPMFDLKQMEKWPRIYGFSVTWKDVSAVWITRQPQTQQYFLYAEYDSPTGDPAQQAAAIGKIAGVDGRGVMTAKIPGREEKQGYIIARQYTKLGMHIETMPYYQDGDLIDLAAAFRSGKLKVCSNLQRFFDQYRMYRRNPDTGKLPDYGAGVIMATLVAWRARDKMREPSPIRKEPQQVKYVGTGSGWMSS